MFGDACQAVACQLRLWAIVLGWFQHLCFLLPHTFTADDMVWGYFLPPSCGRGALSCWCCLYRLALRSTCLSTKNKSMSRRRGSLFACTVSSHGCCPSSCCFLHAIFHLPWQSYWYQRHQYACAHRALLGLFCRVSCVCQSQGRPRHTACGMLWPELTGTAAAAGLSWTDLSVLSVFVGSGLHCFLPEDCLLMLCLRSVLSCWKAAPSVHCPSATHPRGVVSSVGCELRWVGCALLSTCSAACLLCIQLCSTQTGSFCKRKASRQQAVSGFEVSCREEAAAPARE